MLPWQNGTKSVSDRLRKLYDKKLFSDITLLSDEGTKFPAHKLVLIMTSEVWEKILNDDDQIISIQTDLDAKTLMIILRYAYLDEARFETIFDSINTCQASKKYALKDLGHKSVDYALSHLDPNNVCQVYNSVLDQKVPRLNKKLAEVILENQSTISTFLPKCDFKERTSELRELISDQVDPGRLFDSLQQWASNQRIQSKGSTLRDHLTPFLPLIPFLKMTEPEFSSKVVPSRILTEDEVRAITAQISNKNSPDSSLPPLPKWCCSIGLKSPVYDITLSDLISTEFEVDLRHEIYEDGSWIKSLECCFLTRQNGLIVRGLKFTTWNLPEVWRESDKNDPSRLSLTGYLIVEDEGLGRTTKNKINRQLSGNCSDEVQLDLDTPVKMIPGKRIKIKFIPWIMASGRGFCMGKYEKCQRVAPKNSKSGYVLEFSDYENAFSRVKRHGLIDTIVLSTDPQWRDIGLKRSNPNSSL